MLSQEVQRPGSLFQIVEFCPLLIPCGLLGLDAVLQINPQRNFAVFFGLPLHEPPFDALGDGFFGVGFAQRFAAGEPFLSGRTERNILDKIGTTLGLETRWYVSDTPAQLQHLFSELYSAAETEPIGYFKIKAIELLYHMDQLTQINGCDLKYFDKKQIQTTKAIREYLISHLDEKVSLEQLAKEAHLNLSVFHLVFSHIYGDTPYAYLKKYKMNLAAQWLSEDKMKIGDIALELGYSNASKFAKAFQSVYGMLPKDYRKNK